jgi:hypothetical protein
MFGIPSGMEMLTRCDGGATGLAAGQFFIHPNGELGVTDTGTGDGWGWGHMFGVSGMGTLERRNRGADGLQGPFRAFFCSLAPG